jgi:hypothetical protein
MMGFFRKSQWGKVDFLMAGGWAIVILIWAAPIFGKIEGAIFPVLDPRLTIAAYHDHNAGTRVDGWAVKVRNCDYVDDSLQWWLGSPESAVSAPVVLLDPPQLRTTGRTEWEGIVIGLSPKQIERRSYATVRHRCHALWETQTIFYMGAN